MDQIYPIRLSAHKPIVLAMIAAGLLHVSQSVFADQTTDRVKELEAKLEQSLKTIQLLQHRMEVIENKSASSTIVQTPQFKEVDTSKDVVVRATAAKIEALEQNVTQMAQSLSQRKNDGVPLHGFADVGLGQQSGMDYSKLPKSQESTRLRGFNAGFLSFYLTPDLGNRIKTLFELGLEYDKEGGVGIDTERAQLGYTLSNDQTIWAGRFHTPMGYWNTAFHHGAQIQTSLNRPRFLEFEDKGGVIPAHSTGAWLTGKRKAGDGQFTYDVYVANGSQIKTKDNDKVLSFGGFTDDNGAKMVGFNTGYEFPNGFKLGLHGYQDRVATYGADVSTTLAKTKVNMMGGYAFYEDDHWEVIGEYYGFKNKTLENNVGVDFATLGNHTSRAGFVQAAYTFAGNIVPYVRYEKAKYDQNDSYFNSQNSGIGYDRVALGLRYNLTDRSAVKVEINQTKDKAGKQLDGSDQANLTTQSYTGLSYSRLQMQYAIGF